MIKEIEIRQIINNETLEDFYPITHIKAVVDDSGKSLDQILLETLGNVNQVLDEINGEII